MVAELLLEIGTEEIPSGYLEPGLKAFKELTETCLKDNRIEAAHALAAGHGLLGQTQIVTHHGDVARAIAVDLNKRRQWFGRAG